MAHDCTSDIFQSTKMAMMTDLVSDCGSDANKRKMACGYDNLFTLSPMCKYGRTRNTVIETSFGDEGKGS